MFSLRFTPQAHRALQTRPPQARRLLFRLLRGVAQLAVLFPLRSGVWRRLGRVDAHGLEVELEGSEVLLRIAQDREEVHVLRVRRALPERRTEPRSKARAARSARPRPLPGRAAPRG